MRRTPPNLHLVHWSVSRRGSDGAVQPAASWERREDTRGGARGTARSAEVRGSGNTESGLTPRLQQPPPPPQYSAPPAVRQWPQQANSAYSGQSHRAQQAVVSDLNSNVHGRQTVSFPHEPTRPVSRQPAERQTDRPQSQTGTGDRLAVRSSARPPPLQQAGGASQNSANRFPTPPTDQVCQFIYPTNRGRQHAAFRGCPPGGRRDGTF